LAELADALDSKSNSEAQNLSEKQSESQSPLFCFSSAVSKLAAEWPNLAPEIRDGITTRSWDGLACGSIQEIALGNITARTIRHIKPEASKIHSSSPIENFRGIFE
jgi:hypothetical protein